MKSFTFRLATVRRLREQEEQAVQTELAGLLRDLVLVQAGLAESLAAEQELYDYLRRDTTTVADLAHMTNYGALHRRRIMDARVQIAGQEATIGRCRQRLAEARMKREALDKLELRQRAEHRKAELAEELRELDEIGQRKRTTGMKSLVSTGVAA